MNSENSSRELEAFEKKKLRVQKILIRMLLKEMILFFFLGTIVGILFRMDPQ